MKKFLTILAVSSLMLTVDAQAAKKGDIAKYRRSSLTMILMEDPEMNAEIAPIVRATFDNAVAPIKFNDHNIDGFRTFIPSAITDADYASYDAVNPPKKQSFGKALGLGLLGAVTSSSNSDENAAKFKEEQDKIKRDLGTQAYKYLLENNIAHRMMDKWFSELTLETDEEGNSKVKYNLPTAETGLSLSTIQERAVSDATPLDKIQAQAAADQLGILTSAGMELIGNSFVVVSRYRYMTANEYAEEMAKVADATTGGLGLGDLTKSFTGMGDLFKGKNSKSSYVITVRTYLFQLVWDEAIQQTVSDNFNNFEAFANMPFSLKFIGYETATASCGSKKERTQEEIIAMATMRAFDKVIAKLERKYEVFRTKTPIMDVEPEVTIGIGTKECVEKKDKFEILEQVVDEKTGRVVYKRCGVMQVDPSKIWDNDEESDNYQEEGATVLKGKVKNIYPSMLVRQTNK